KLEGMLAKALQLEGYRPVILAFRESRWAKPYFNAFGIDEFVYPDQLLSPEREAEAERAAAEFLAGEVSVQSLKALEFHSAGVGRQTLSSLSRRFFQGHVSLAEPHVRAAVPQVLTEAMRSVLR